jgi:GNAT superfamily N-acetyltransferase
VRLSDDTLRVADSWWARDFACDPGELRPAGTRVQEHKGELTGNEGIWILVTGPCPIVSMPAAIPRQLKERARSWTAAMVENTALLERELIPAVVVDKIVGPAYIGYATQDSLKTVPAPSARVLVEQDSEAVVNFRGRCSPEEWEHGGSEFGKVPTFGSFDSGGVLAAIAGYKEWKGAQGVIAHIAIVTAQDSRRMGHGVAAVALAAEHALKRGLLPQYRTLKSNAPSMRVAGKLGFAEYGFSVYVRLAGSRGLA